MLACKIIKEFILEEGFSSLSHKAVAVGNAFPTTYINSKIEAQSALNVYYVEHTSGIPPLGTDSCLHAACFSSRIRAF